MFLHGLWCGTAGENLIAGFAYTAQADGTWSGVGNLPSGKSYIGSSQGYHSNSNELGLDPTIFCWAQVPSLNPIRIRPRFEGYNNIEISIGVNRASAKGFFSLVVTEVQQ